MQQALQTIHRRVLRREYSPPTLFAVVKAVGAGIHKQIIARQNAAASAMLMDPVHGQRLKELKHAEMANAMRKRTRASATLGILVWGAKLQPKLASWKC